MSFSSDVKEELNSIQIKGNCCKKAYILGAILSAETNGNHISVKITDISTAEKIKVLLRLIFNITPVIKTIKRGCFDAIQLDFESKKLSEFVSLADIYDGSDISRKIYDSYFSCSQCKSVFLRGVFCNCGTVSDPQKTSALEIRTPSSYRALLLDHIAEDIELSPLKTTQRKNAIGSFYKKESHIENFFAAIGLNKILFKLYDINIEKDIKNHENRATNCVTRNISKSIDAAALHISAIEALVKNKVFDEMAPEIKLTAKLRLENPDITLTELSELHKPKISKSGISHRLSKIVDEARKRKLI